MVDAAVSARSARGLALSALGRIRRDGAFAAPVIADLIDQSALDRRDRNFSALLVKGVITYTGVLDETIDYFLAHPQRTEPRVRDALRISAYELLILKSPTHAAVNEGVSLVASVAPAARRLSNAVLRRIAEAAPSFPYGDPAVDDEAAARFCALPLWLFQRLAADRGRDEALTFGRASLQSPPLYVAIASDEVVDGLVRLGDAPKPCAPYSDGERALPPRCYRLSSAAVLAKPEVKPWLDTGAIVVADGASQLMAALALGEQWPETLLEIGAGRGTKTLLLQRDALDRWQRPPKESVALDANDGKLAVASERLANAGLGPVEFVAGDATALDEALADNRRFDRIFIDAPCTGVGTIRRHPEIRWRLQPATIEEKAELGLRMLTAAARQLAPGGLLTYATCTIIREENEGVLERFLTSPAGAAFAIVPTFGVSVASTLANHEFDAHTGFRLRRRERI